LVLKLLVALEIGHSSKTASTTAAVSAVPADAGGTWKTYAPGDHSR
jgi:hypothetical protein